METTARQRGLTWEIVRNYRSFFWESWDNDVDVKGEWSSKNKHNITHRKNAGDTTLPQAEIFGVKNCHPRYLYTSGPTGPKRVR